MLITLLILLLVVTLLMNRLTLYHGKQLKSARLICTGYKVRLYSLKRPLSEAVGETTVNGYYFNLCLSHSTKYKKC